MFQGSIEIMHAQPQLFGEISQADFPRLKLLLELSQTMLKAQINQLGQKLGNVLTPPGCLATFRRPENFLLDWYDDFRHDFSPPVDASYCAQ